jgi:hypothetical protein
MLQLVLALSFPKKPNLRRRKRKPVNVDNSQKYLRTIKVNGRLSGNGLLDLWWRTPIISHVRNKHRRRKDVSEMVLTRV